MGAATNTPAAIHALDARERIRRHLIEKYGYRNDEDVMIVLWDEDEAREHGWYADGPTQRGQVCWEGGPDDWAAACTQAVFSGDLVIPGFYLECATSFIVTLYPRPV